MESTRTCDDHAAPPGPPGEATAQPYLSYWGKAGMELDRRDHHLLPFHCLDVAAVGLALARARPRWLDALASAAGVRREGLEQFVAFLLAIHDLGKFGDGFQSLRSDLHEQLGRHTQGRPNTPRHDALGLLLWKEFAEPPGDPTRVTRYLPEAVLDVRGADGLFPRPGRTKSVLEPWMSAVTGHHGRPPGTGDNPEASFREHFDFSHADAAEYVRDVRRLLAPPALAFLLPAQSIKGDSLRASSWWLAGFAILCDWIGSNRDWFPYESARHSLEKYWEHTQERAAEAIEKAGFAESKIRAFPGFRSLFPKIQRPPSWLQEHAATIPLGGGPQLFMIEDLTGSGKTEAALTLVARLLEADRADGFFFALPTMATANAMYSRVADVLDGLFESKPSFLLAHSGIKLEADETLGSGELEDRPEGGYERNESSASQTARLWLSDSRKKALLADVGVGTIDQALAGALKAKHNTLRLLGLSRHVLVVDEVHACDEYMNGLLESLLRVHARNGGSAILLSATLPLDTRHKLIQAFQEGAATEHKAVESEDYPVLVRVGADAVTPFPRPVGDFPERQTGIAFHHTFEEVVDWCLQKAEENKCAVWIRNTVRDALAAYDAIVERVGADRVQLFHARFPMHDRLVIETDVVSRFGKKGDPGGRRKRIVIATQVLEQSLDVDFDEMVSDLAPIDRLIQRAGRLHRHPRKGRSPPVLHLFAPDWTDTPDKQWPGTGFRGTATVYNQPSLLWRTQKILRTEGKLLLPLRARALVEAVYGPDEATSELFLAHKRENDAAGETLQHRAMSRHNRIELQAGYLKSGADWDEDEIVPTRLGDPTKIIRLIRLIGERPVPWSADSKSKKAQWRSGEVTLRADQVVGSAHEESLRNALRSLNAEPPSHVTPVALKQVGDEWRGEALARRREKDVAMQVVFIPGRGLDFRPLEG